MTDARRTAPPPTLRARLLAAIAAGVLATLACMAIRLADTGDAADFRQARWLVDDLLAGRDPYGYVYHAMYVPYPLPAGLFALPFVGLPDWVAGPLFIGISSGLLAYGLTRDGYERLVLFLCAPYWAAVDMVQWSPLVAAAAFFWWLAPVLLAKPQVALPILVTHFSWRGALAVAAVLLLSLAVMPDWPIRWLGGIGEYQRVTPLLTLPGLLLPLALLRWRDRDTWLLLLSAVTPQRAIYDLTALWLIPRSARGLAATAIASWAVVIIRPSFTAEPASMLAWGAYLPMLVVLLLRARGTTADRVPRLGASQTEKAS